MSPVDGSQRRLAPERRAQGGVSAQRADAPTKVAGSGAAPLVGDALRAHLTAAVHAMRARTDALFALVHPDGLLERPVAERHRLLFYIGHLEVFDWSLVVRGCGGAPSRNEEWESLFAFGIDPLDGAGPTDTPAQWPALAAIRAHGAQLRDDVDRAIEHLPFKGWLEDGWAVRIALEHRSMHAETLAYLLHQLPLKWLEPSSRAVIDRPSPRCEPVAIPAGRATLGRSRAQHAHRGWDNEYEEHTVDVPAFEIDRYAVSNADWSSFIEAGGYHDRRWWSDADWSWRQRANVEQPAFWRRDGDQWRLRLLRAEVPMPWSWPVYVSHAEASAYATWRGARLPSEAQWHRAALGTPSGGERALPWGDAAPQPGVHGNFGSVAEDPSPVDGHPAGASAFGVHGLVGNGWQWTRTVFEPFAGFEPLPFYGGYSADFFDGRHFVLKGASPATDTGLVRRSFRNWFQPHYPFVYAAFRCVHE